MAHLHSVYDTDNHFSIDATTRTIKNESKKTTIVQYDHNSERFTFELPRYIDGHDMSVCNKVEVHCLNVDANTKAKAMGVYTVDDLQISPDDENKVICSWLISGNATQYAGVLSFLLRFCCLTGSTVDYAWNTKPYSDIYVSDGLNASETVAEEYKDILEQWKAELFAAGYINADSMQNDIEVLKARMDTFASLPDGSTVGDAELMDIRVGADGVTYESAGTAVREQGKRISGEVDALAGAIYSKIVVTNFFDKQKTVEGYIANDGVVQTLFYRYAMMVRPGDTIRFTYEELFNTQNGVFYDGGGNLLATVSSVATNEGAYKEVVVPALATKIVLNMQYPSVFIITRNADYPAEYVPHQIEIPEQVVKYNNVEYIEDYNLYDEGKLIDGYINASGGIVTEVLEFKHIRVDVASGDVIRYTYEDVFYSQNGGVYDENDVFLCNLTDRSANCGAYKEYVADGEESYILINFRTTTKNVISRNNRYDASFDGFKMNASMPSGKYLDKLNSMMDTKIATAINVRANKTNYHALFENVCCIGDSLTEGDYGNGLGVHGYSYPRAFANLAGCNVVNLGASGQSAKSWWEIKERKFPAESLDFSKYDCFFILLGQNEGLSGTMDSGDNSNLGYYCKIIEAIRAANHTASVFLLTIPHNIADDANESTNAIIKSVGSNYDLPVLDLRDSDILTIENIPVNQPYDNAMHYGKVGSLHLAMEVKRLMEESVCSDLTRYNVIDS